MLYWTLTKNKSKWESYLQLKRSDSMGNVLDRIEEERGSILKRVEYPDGFLDQFSDLIDSYVFTVDETMSYDNDDFPEASYENRKSFYTRVPSKSDVIISDGKPVGFMLEITSYAGAYMDNRTWTEGYLFFFEEAKDHPGEKLCTSRSIRGGDRRHDWTRVYSLVKKSDADKM